VVMGCAMQQGSQGLNVARVAAIAAGLPTTVSGMSIDRQCSSGLMAVATAAKQVMFDGAPVVVAGGMESISLVQNEHMNMYRAADPRVLEIRPDMYMPMIETAEVVAKRYGISRDACDEYAFQSQQRTAAAQQSGLFDDEIIEVTASQGGGRPRHRRDHVRRGDAATRRGQPARHHSRGSLPAGAGEGRGGNVTAGNASQLSDGAAALV
jgi:acetyl-CoA C-acetyltransferase